MKLNLWREYYGGMPIKFVVLISFKFIYKNKTPLGYAKRRLKLLSVNAGF